MRLRGRNKFKESIFVEGCKEKSCAGRESNGEALGLFAVVTGDDNGVSD